MATPRVLEFDVMVDPDRTASSGFGGQSIPRQEAWWPEHFVLVGLVRCTLASMDYHAERAGLRMTGSGQAHGKVRKRDDDGLYAFVEIDSSNDIELSPAPTAAVVRELIARAERGCYVGNSLQTRPRYRWTVNSEVIG